MTAHRWLVECQHLYNVAEARTAREAAEDSEMAGRVTVSPIGDPEQFIVSATFEATPTKAD